MRHAGGKNRRHLPKYTLPVLGAASTHCLIATLFPKVAAVVGCRSRSRSNIYAGSKSQSKSKHQSERKDER